MGILMKSSWLLTHNPRYSDPPTFDTHNWSFGNRIHGVERGDVVWLMRLGEEPRGLLARGRVVSNLYQFTHWENQYRTANYADVEWETIIGDADYVLPIKELKLIAPGMNWTPQQSGITMPDDVAQALAPVWEDWVKTYDISLFD